MIPVKKRKEPGDFAEMVTRKADAFLKKIPNPTKKDIDNRPLWRNALDDLYEAYEEVCAYSGLWFHRDAVSVDHFIPVCDIWSTNPEAAYEWDNFRLASRSMNTEKGDHRDVVDPFRIGLGWFVIDFPSMIVKSGSDLEPSDKAKVDAAIRRLKLNNIEKKYIAYRRKLIRYYSDMVGEWGKIAPAIAHLRKMAPFIASELERQALTEQIVEMLKPWKKL